MDFSARIDEVVAHDGRSFPLHVVVPRRGRGPGVLLLHEIFGVNAYIREVAQRLALLGYVVAAPDLFWRIDPDHPIERQDAELDAAIERAGGLDAQEAVRDADAALAHLSRLGETTGSVGVLGFCLGGTLAFGVGLHSEPDTVVSYYGSGVPDLVAGADALDCPVLAHFGTRDPYLPLERVEEVRTALADREGVEVHLFDAGHAFDNHLADTFHEPVAARAAWGVTADFLRRTLWT
ncbi:MAG: dienelactone hydrolase family protein [Acidimicrobiales bacterium]|jgi:carboxymethylenebutenolidase|nr:dienelactone hydrolase family protein [Acidimicrobiales bacterium]